MKKFACLLVLMLFCSSVFAENIIVPAGTVIPFEYDITVSSKKIQQDEQIPITVIRDVIVDGNTIFQRGAKGYLVVFDVFKVQTWNISEYKKGGYIDIEDGAVQDVNGTMRHISFKEYKKGQDLGNSYSSSTYGYANINNKYNPSSTNINAMERTVMQENRLTGENVSIFKGTRAKAVISAPFKIDIKSPYKENQL